MNQVEKCFVTSISSDRDGPWPDPRMLLTHIKKRAQPSHDLGIFDPNRWDFFWHDESKKIIREIFQNQTNDGWPESKSFDLDFFWIFLSTLCDSLVIKAH